MEALKGINLLVRFLLELCMLAAVGYWGVHTQSTWTMKVLLGIGLPLLIAVFWGMFVSPKAKYPLRGLPRLVVELILLGSGSVALFASGQTSLAWTYTGVLIFHEALKLAWKQ